MKSCPPKKYLKSVIIVFLCVFSIHVISEGYYKFVFSKNVLYKPDEILGWAPKNNFKLDKIAKDFSGKEYKISVSTNKYGFRWWGETDSDRNKILILGDSYTGDPNMSDEDSYFGQISKLTNSEVFAYGAGGYGTLQEFLVIKEYIDTINPNIIILQFDTNDFSNNSYYIESESFARNQKYLRPYYDGENIFYRNQYLNLYKYIYINSTIFRLLDILAQQIQYKIYDDYYYNDVNNNVNSIDFGKSIKITENIFSKISSIAKEGTLLITFCSGTDEPDKIAEWTKISRKTGFIPLIEPALAVEFAESGGIQIRASDGAHWNSVGHVIAGKILSLQLNKLTSKKMSLVSR